VKALTVGKGDNVVCQFGWEGLLRRENSERIPIIMLDENTRDIKIIDPMNIMVEYMTKTYILVCSQMLSSYQTHRSMGVGRFIRSVTWSLHTTPPVELRDEWQALRLGSQIYMPVPTCLTAHPATASRKH